jgi:hypothetical protein
MVETWRTVELSDDTYSVSDLGNVRRDKAGHGVNRSVPYNLVLCETPSGYLRVLFCINNKRSMHFVHRLIANTFIGPCPDGSQINHKNGIKIDNRPENLEWVTPKENMYHARNILMKITPTTPRGERWHQCHPLSSISSGEKHGGAKLTEEKVLEIHRRLRSGERGTDIAKLVSARLSA